jgi:hypothetical protein
MKTYLYRVACALGLGAFASLTLLAQTTATLRGTVESGQSTLPGVTVEARSPNLQGVRSAVTDNEGRFALTLLPPGRYTVTATLDGFSPKSESVSLSLSQVATMRIEMLPAKAEKVTVTAEPATVETESNTVGRNLDAKAFQALPTGRNYASVAQLASGVNTDDSDVRQTAITVYGSTGLENNYLVDGANTTGAEIGNQGKVLNFEFIQEVELKSGGYEAEYTGAMGGILNVITKSGGNDFHGDAFGYFDNDGLQATNKHLCVEGTGAAGEPPCELLPTPQGVPVGFTKQDYGADIGGYVLKDRLWFFGAYDHVKNTLNSQVTTGTEAGTQTNLDTSSNLYSGKLTWNMAAGQTLIGTVFGDPTDDVGAVGPVIGPPTTYEGTVTVGGTDFGARYQGILATNWLVTGQFAYHRENVDTLPGPGGDAPYVLDNTSNVVTASGGFGGSDGTGQFATKKFTRYDYMADVTYIFGNHDIKAGFGYQQVDADVIRNYSGGQLVSILSPLPDDPLQRTVYSHQFFASPDSTIDNASIAPVIATPNNNILAVFLQDRWSVLSNLTINAGVRWEKQRIVGQDNVTYISVDHFSPRVGFTWDFLNNGRSKAYASYSQFVPIVPIDMNIRSLNGERDGSTFNFSPTDLNCDPQADTPDTPCEIRGTATDVIDPNIKSPYSDEILAGVQMQVTRDWAVGVKGIYRSIRRVLEDTYIADLENYAFFNPGSSVLAPEFAPGKRYFRGVEFTVQKNLADHWALYASYLYGTLEGNFDGYFRAIGGFFARNPSITDDFDYPEFQVNAYGDLTLDRRHQAKLQVSYLFPFGLTLAVAGYYQTGTPLSRIGWWDPYVGPELFITPRGTEGRSPNTYEMDLQGDYGLQLGPVTVHVLASLFNVLNKQQVTQVDQVWANEQANNDLPYPTNGTYGQGQQWQQPRTLRLGLRVSF